MELPKFYSQAWNFNDSNQTGVDPRTGLFSTTLPLLTLQSDYLAGPALLLSLRYSPLLFDKGCFGLGFTLNLTRYNVITGRLILATGEEYVINNNRSSIMQKKFKNFIFEKTDYDNYRVIHKSGIIEELYRHGNEYITELIRQPDGHGLILVWDKSLTSLARLKEIKNNKGNILCKLDYSKDSIHTKTLSVLPNDVEFGYNIKFMYKGDYLSTITSDADPHLLEWKLDYSSVAQIKSKNILSSVTFPTGLQESVIYDKKGMSFPENIGWPDLPRVYQHTLIPGGEQPQTVTRWEWTPHNYLGRGLIQNKEEGIADPLMHSLIVDYEYGSTAKVLDLDGSTILCSVTRRYNSFHLLVSERTLRDGKMYVVLTTYHAKYGTNFDEQPLQYFLPVSQTELWDDGNARKYGKTRVTYWTFDESGNLLREQAPNGTLTEYIYYPSKGEKGCPADPHGFIRYLKRKTVTPPKLNGDEPITVSEHTWTKIQGGTSGYFVLPRRVVDITGNMKVDVNREYNDYPSDPFSWGREKKRTTRFTPDIKSRRSYTQWQEFEYERTTQGLKQMERLRNFENKIITRSTLHHPHRGHLISETDAQGIISTYTYDKVGRVISRIDAEKSDYETRRSWSYEITEKGPVTCETDIFGNQEKFLFDGLGRKLKQSRLDRDRTNKWYDVSLQKYNSLGELVSDSVSDWLTEKDKPVVNCIETEVFYDGWGNISKQSFSDGTKSLRTIDPINLTYEIYAEGSSDGKEIRTAAVTTFMDEKSRLPLKEIRKNNDGKVQSVRYFKWDGLGRLRQVTDEMKSKTIWKYDVLGRILTSTLADGSIISRTYAPHLTGDQVTEISVTKNNEQGDTQTTLLGSQCFDGLGRITKKIIGGRTTIYTYEGVSPIPSSLKQPTNKTIKYSHIPELDNVISNLTADGINQKFNFNATTGQMVTAEEGSTKIKLTRYASGNLQSESFTRDDITLSTKHTYTLAGAINSYTDVTGNETVYERDEFGRLSSIKDAAMTINLKYDALGQLSVQSVTDNFSKTSLTTTLAYDEFGREISRTITDFVGLGVTLKVMQQWQKNDLLALRTTYLGNELISREKYVYDTCNRLFLYLANGSLLPQDAYGYEITSSIYKYDELNNLITITTGMKDGCIDTATYHYRNATDPTQLTSVTHTHKNYPQTINLSYDANGCMAHDESGRKLDYDAIGRLLRNSSKDIIGDKYHYDALNRMVGAGTTHHLYYRASELVCELLTSQGEGIRFVKIGHTCLGVHQKNKLTLTAVDHHDSLLLSRRIDQSSRQLHLWTPYGSGKSPNHLPGFNGERVDQTSGAYHLGNGYRAYNPALMRFNCPDSLSPFGAGGINPYAYCAGDPVNRIDPSGHISWVGWLGISLGVIGLGLTLFAIGAAIAATGGIMAALSASSTTTLVAGGLGVISDVAAIASGVIEESNPQASAVLGWVSLGTGVAGIGLGIKGGLGVTSRAHGGGVMRTLSHNNPRLGHTTQPRGATELGRSFYLFRAPGTRARRLLVTAHGEQSLFPKYTSYPLATKINHYAEDGYRLIDPGLSGVAAGRYLPRESIMGTGFGRNYNLMKFENDTYGSVRSISRRYGVDVLTVRNRAINKLYPADLNSLFGIMQNNNINYKVIDLIHCREPWLWHSPSQSALLS